MVYNSREVIDTGIPNWNRMRGTQMVAAVKVISLGFDMDRKKIRDFPNPVEFWGYIFCPGNVIMGPWCAYNDYLSIFNQSPVVSVSHLRFIPIFCVESFFINVPIRSLSAAEYDVKLTSWLSLCISDFLNYCIIFKRWITFLANCLIRKKRSNPLYLCILVNSTWPVQYLSQRMVHSYGVNPWFCNIYNF